MTTLKKIFRKINFLFFLLTFDKFFSISEVVDEKGLEKIFRLRYEVYCEEKEYLDKNNFINEIEKDEFDAFSKHFILTNSKNQLIGVVRVVNNSPLGLPIEKNFKLSHPLIGNKKIEISRLIIKKEYRNKFLLLGLIKALYIYAKREGITSAYCVLDDNLFVRLQSMGFCFIKIGQSANYQGLTSPYLISLVDMVTQLKKKNKPLLYFMTRIK